MQVQATLSGTASADLLFRTRHSIERTIIDSFYANNS